MSAPVPAGTPKVRKAEIFSLSNAGWKRVWEELRTADYHGAASGNRDAQHPMVVYKMECKKCGKIYPLGETWCPFCGIRLMETVAENVDGADVSTANLDYGTDDGTLEQGIGFETGLYSVLLTILVIIICILGGVYGYVISGSSIGGICLGLFIGLFCGILATLSARLLIIVARNTKIIADNQHRIGQGNSP